MFWLALIVTMAGAIVNGGFAGEAVGTVEFVRFAFHATLALVSCICFGVVLGIGNRK